MHQEDLSGNPNMQLGGLLAPYPTDEGVQIVEEVLRHRVEDGRVFVECWTTGGEWATVVFTPVDERVMRMTMYPAGVPREPRETGCLVPDPPVPLVAPLPRFGTLREQAVTSPLDIHTEERDGVLSIWAGDLLVEITKKPWEMALKNRQGYKIVQENRADTNLRGWRRASWLGYRRAADGGVAATFDALAGSAAGTSRAGAGSR